MICKNCGKQLDDNDEFCSNCGTIVYSSEKVSAEVIESPVEDVIAASPVNTNTQNSGIKPDYKERIPDYLSHTNASAIVLLVVSVVCCCGTVASFFMIGIIHLLFDIAAIVLAIISLVKSSKILTLWSIGDKLGAERAKNTVSLLNKFGWAAFAASIFVIIVGIILTLVLFSFNMPDFYDSFKDGFDYNF